MKRNQGLVLFLLAVFLSPVYARGLSVRTLEGNGRVESRNYSFSGFDRLEVSSALKAEISHDSGWKTVISMDSNLFEALDISLSGKTLRIGLKPGCSISSCTEFKATVTMPALRFSAFAGAVKGSIRGFEDAQSDCDIRSSGASEISAQLTARKLGIGMSGSGTIALKGRAETLDCSISGAGSLQAFDFAAQRVLLETSGLCSCEVSAEKQLKVKISGMGSVRYRGKPDIQKQVSGMGSIEPVE